MRLRCIALLITGMLTMLAFAQTSPAEPVLQSTGNYNMFSAGDSMLSLSAGLGLGVGFFDAEGSYLEPNLKPAVNIGLSYMMYASPNLSFGGEFDGCFYETARDRQFFFAPLMAKAAWTFDLSPFMIIPHFGLGMGISVLGDNLRHVDALASIGSSFAWRYNADVSYELKLRFDIVPQFYIDTPQSNATMILFGIMVGANYHL
ncbi:MAG: porin family protein [Spirochaetes bacterium]|nr:porin family protein [Spirochaetota bacterium]MBU0955585.1 porin family protein [Spirochaetota bacterium]